MKKARKVEIDPDKVLSFSDYTKLSEHAFNSTVWYVTNTPKSSGQIRDKLYEKGYPHGTVKATDIFGNVVKINLVEEAIQHAIDSAILDDEFRVRSYVKSKVSDGVALPRIAMMLKMKKFPAEMVDEVIAEYQEEESEKVLEGIYRIANRVTRMSSFSKLDSFQKRQKLVRSLMSKGFSYSDISDIVDELLSDE